MKSIIFSGLYMHQTSSTTSCTLSDPGSQIDISSDTSTIATSLKKSPPQSQRKLTTIHLDKSSSHQEDTSSRVSTYGQQKSLETNSPGFSLHYDKLSGFGDDFRLRGDVAVKPITETVIEPQSHIMWGKKFSPDEVMKGITEVDQAYLQKKAHEPTLASFELPSLLQSFLSGTSLTTPRERESMDWGEDLVMHPDVIPLVSSESAEVKPKAHKNADTSKKVSKEKKYALEKLKMNRSESSSPLIYPENCIVSERATLLEPVPLENMKKVRAERQGRSSPTKLVRQEVVETVFDTKYKSDSHLKSSSTLSETKSLTESTSSSESKRECHICKREEEMRRKKQQEQLRFDYCRRLAWGDKSAKAKRETMRPQSSLDSARERHLAMSKVRQPLSRSGSLDLDTASKTDSLSSRDGSLSISQDSLQSDIGGAPTLHRYYHVFREGELDQLIEKYVQNLHIISSYYDHANWCIIAEKVQVWTI